MPFSLGTILSENQINTSFISLRRTHSTYLFACAIERLFWRNQRTEFVNENLLNTELLILLSGWKLVGCYLLHVRNFNKGIEKVKPKL